MAKIRRKKVKKSQSKILKTTNKRKSVRKCYTNECIERAVAEVKNGEKVSLVSKRYNISEFTLRAKIIEKYSN